MRPNLRTDMPEQSPQSVPDLMRLRREYSQRTLREQDVNPDPIRQFLIWLDEAIAAGANEPNAMTLATANKSGTPSARMVLLKRVDTTGFAFFTNYESRKAKELDENPVAALVFYWPEVERQVRVEGKIVRTSDSDSDAYFASRPIEAQIGAWASDQSQPIESREALEARVAEVIMRFGDGNVPRPAHWGGYLLIPSRIEFWQGGSGRLHDRLEYSMDSSRSGWTLRRLAP